MSTLEPPGQPEPWQAPQEGAVPPPPPPPPPTGGYPAQYPPQAPGGYPPAYPPAPRTSGRAVAVMVLGIAGLLMICGYGVGAIPAIIALALAPGAKREIAASGGTVTGEGFVKAGVICSWVTIGLTVVGVVLLIALFAIGTTTESTFDSTTDVIESGVGLVGALAGLPLLRPGLRRLRDLPLASPVRTTEEN